MHILKRGFSNEESEGSNVLGIVQDKDLDETKFLINYYNTQLSISHSDFYYEIEDIGNLSMDDLEHDFNTIRHI